MRILTDLLVVLTALEFFFIFYLETLATASEKTAATFGMSRSDLQGKSLNVLFKNQGVYNLAIGVLLLAALLIFHSQVAVALFLVNILLVAAYGAISSNPKILLQQGGLAALALVFLILFGI